MAYGPPQSAYTTQTPSSSTTGTGSYGSDIVFAVAGRITGLRHYWSAAAADTARTMRMWSTAGVALGSVVNNKGGASNAWQSATLASPLSITAGQTVRVCIDLASSNVARYNIPAVDIVNGDLTIPKDKCYFNSAANTFPGAGETTSRHYFVDVVFEAGTADPTGGRPKVYAAGSWTAKPAKVYSGGTWTEKPMKRHNGTTWVALT